MSAGSIPWFATIFKILSKLGKAQTQQKRLLNPSNGLKAFIQNQHLQVEDIEYKEQYHTSGYKF